MSGAGASAPLRSGIRRDYNATMIKDEAPGRNAYPRTESSCRGRKGRPNSRPIQRICYPSLPPATCPATTCDGAHGRPPETRASNSTA